jgi:hypothetical protein
VAVLSRIGSAHSGHRLISAYSSAAAQLLRTYAVQVETLRRMRGIGVQQVRVEQVHINGESQAIIGNYMRERALAAHVIARLAAHPDRYFADQAAWTAHLEKLGIAALKVNPDPVLIGLAPELAEAA